MKKLSVGAPSPELVEAYLTEIAKGYGVKWTPRTFTAETEVPESGPSKVSGAFFIWPSFDPLRLP